MVAKEFVPLVPSSSKPHKNSEAFLVATIKNGLKLETLLLLGALIQIFLLVVLPYRVALLPAIALALNSLVRTAIQLQDSQKNPFLNDVIPGRVSAQLPSTEDGRFGSKPADKPVVVFHFGARLNHPLGIFSPGAKQLADWFDACMVSVKGRSEEYGLLGVTSWHASERSSNNTLMNVFYFRDVEGLNKFAHDDIHKQAWKWIEKANYKHISFYHEAFCVPQNAYESIYVNCPPLLMGATNIKCPDGEGNEVYQRPIVSADVGPLKSQFGRMGRAFKDQIQ